MASTLETECHPCQGTRAPQLQACRGLTWLVLGTCRQQYTAGFLLYHWNEIMRKKICCSGHSEFFRFKGEHGLMNSKSIKQWAYVPLIYIKKMSVQLPRSSRGRTQAAELRQNLGYIRQKTSATVSSTAKWKRVILTFQMQSFFRTWELKSCCYL